MLHQITDLGKGLLIGISLGIALGLATDRFAVGIALGVALGFGIGNALEITKNRRSSTYDSQTRSNNKKQKTTLFVIMGLTILAVALYILSRLRPLLF